MELSVEQNVKIKLAFMIAMAKQIARDKQMDHQTFERLIAKIKNGVA